MIQLSTARLARMYEAGATFRDIAKEVDCSEMTVRNRLRKFGVKSRPPGRRPREER